MPRAFMTLALSRSILNNSYVPREEADVPISLILNGVNALIAPSVFVSYRVSHTPVISAVLADSVLTNGDVITILGSGFALSGNKVTTVQSFYNKESVCQIISQNTTTIVCQIASAVMASSYVKVVVPGYGIAQTLRSCPHGTYLMCDGQCLSDMDCSVSAWGRFGCDDIVNLIYGDTYCDSNGGDDNVNKP